MKSVRIRFLYAVLLCLVLCAVVALGSYVKSKQEQADLEAAELEKDVEPDSIRLWYYRSDLSDFLAGASLQYYEQTGIMVIPSFVDGTGFLEKAYEASVRGTDGPDLLITDSETIGIALMSGLAKPVEDESFVRNSARFSVRAQDSVSYNSQIAGYPLCFETPVFIYNSTYLKEIAKAAILAERDTLAAEMEQERIDEWAAAGIIPEAAPEVDISADEELTGEVQTTEPQAMDEELIAAAESYALTILPKTIEDILVIGEEFDSPEGVENMFTWDVSDVFFNYFFLGQYLNVGGESGDNKDMIDIYNEQSMAALRAFNRCSEFFAADPTQKGTEHILEDFIAGKTLFALVSSDDLKKLETACEDGGNLQEYGVMVLPDLAESLQSRGLSVTEAVIVNEYSKNISQSEEFARFLSNEYADSMYDLSGKIACKKDTADMVASVAVAQKAYEKAAALPKMPEASDFWMKLEIVMSKAWRGEDANDLLKELSQEVKGQILGQKVTEDFIENPKTIDEIMAEQIEYEEAQEAPFE